MKKLLCSYPEVVKYLLKKFPKHQAVAKMYSAIMRCTQPFSMTPMQHPDGLYAKSCEVANVQDESNLNDNFIEIIDSSIGYSLNKKWFLNDETAVTNISFKVQSLAATQKQKLLRPRAKNQNANEK